MIVPEFQLTNPNATPYFADHSACRAHLERSGLDYYLMTSRRFRY
jgi:hypothetical protein